jgi:hypothetical protein
MVLPVVVRLVVLEDHSIRRARLSSVLGSEGWVCSTRGRRGDVGGCACWSFRPSALTSSRCRLPQWRCEASKVVCRGYLELVLAAVPAGIVGEDGRLVVE